jgi:uncharacterized protein YyaL (SSP411 family)
MDSPAPPAGWSAWSTEAFARAAAGPRPVLLLLAVRWSDPCRRFDRLVLDDPRIAARLRDQVVGVRVDADERPDIADRYGLGGWPSMAFLTPEGDPIGGGTATTVDRLAGTLDRLAVALVSRRREIREKAEAARRERHAARPQAGGTADTTAPDAFVARVVAQGDPAARAGHLLGSPLQPSHAAAIRLLLHHGKRAGGAAAVDLATALLDDIGWGPLSAGADGGVFRALAEGAGPERVCLLEANAALLDAMLAAAETTGLERCRVRARELAAFVSSRLGGGAAGGFRHACWCEAREAGPEDGLASDGDPAGAAWQVDDRVFVDSSADAAAALLRAAAAFDDEAMASRAIAALDGLVARAYHRAAGLAHVLDPAPRVRGLLSDQVRASAALLDAAEAAGMRVYLDLAEELMRSALAKLWVPEAGALADRVVSPAGAGDVGLLGEPLFPLALNSLAARVLARLAVLTGDAALARRAREILGAFGATWAAAGLDGACYAEAVAEVCCGTLQRPGGS